MTRHLIVVTVGSAGVPQRVIPNAHDQVDNGARLQRLGVGAWPPHNSSPPRFQDTVQQVCRSRPLCRPPATPFAPCPPTKSALHPQNRSARPILPTWNMCECPEE